MSTLQTTNLKNPSSASNNIVLATDGSTTITTLNGTTITGTSVRGVVTSGTAVASTSGTSIDFTGIPSWVKRVTVMLNGVSTNGTSSLQIQLGTSSGFETSSYLGTSVFLQTGVTSTNLSAGFLNSYGSAESASNVRHGSLILTFVASNVWVANGQFALSNSATSSITAGSKTLSGTLDRVRITTVNGTDTFDAGSINIMYEG